MCIVLTKMAALHRIARRPAVRAADLDAGAIPRAYLQRMVERGQLERIGRGLYRRPDAAVTELHTVVTAVLQVPHATICLLSALSIHGLTTELPHAVWMMIDTRARKPQIEAPAIEIVRASGASRTHGVQKRVVEGVSVRVTSPAKTVADCFKYRRHVGLDVALAALRDYLRTHRGGIDTLLAAARADRVERVMRPYLEALA